MSNILGGLIVWQPVIASIYSIGGIPSEEAFGSDGIIAGPIVGVSEIESQEAFGVGGIITGPILGVTGIPTGEAFGTGGQVNLWISGATGIPSAEAFGVGWVSRGMSGLIGIPSAEAFGNSGIVLRFSTSAAPGATDPNMFSIMVGGNDLTDSLRESSLSMERELNFLSSGQFQLVDQGTSIVLSVGNEVIVYYYDRYSASWHRIFGGSVDSFELSKIHVLNTERFITVRCVDYAKILARRVVNMKFTEAEYGTLDSIMAWMQSQILSAEGITYVTRGPTGIVVGDVEFAYVPANEMMDILAETVGGSWSVDFWKNLYIGAAPASVQVAPINITEDLIGSNSNKWLNLKVTAHRGLYRNKQYVKSTYNASTSGVEGGGAADIPTKTVVETYTCPIYEPSPPAIQARYWYLDGMGYAPSFRDDNYKGNIKVIRSIKFNGAETVWFTQINADGTFGTAPSGWEWMQVHQRSSDLIFNMPAHPVMSEWPTTGDVLEITYEIFTEMPVAPAVQVDSGEIAAVRAVEAGTGVWEAVAELSGVFSQDFIENYALQLLAKFGVWGKEVEAEFFYYGLEPGQGITVDLPSYDVAPAQSMTVESVSYREIQRSILSSSVKISNQVQQRDALAAMHRLVKKLRKTSKMVVGVVTWDMAVTYPGIANPGLALGVALGNPYILRFSVNLDNVAVYFKTAPTGASIKLDIKANGVSIFNAPIEYPAGTTGVVTFTTFKTGYASLAVGTIMTIDVTQIGSIVPGKDGVVHLAGWM